MSDLRLHALAYAQRGWRVHPLRPRSKRPVFDDWPRKATTDAGLVEAWWEKDPDANIGIVPDGNLLVVDVDPRNGGIEKIEALIRDHGPLPETLMAYSGRGDGGYHLYYHTPKPVNADLGGGVELLGCARRNLVVPPSLHPETGGEYTWRDTSVPIADAPAWLLNLARTSQRERRASTVNGTILAGDRNATLASLAGTMRSRGMTPSAIRLALIATNLDQCDPPLGEDEVVTIAESISRYPAGSPLATPTSTSTRTPTPPPPAPPEPPPVEADPLAVETWSEFHDKAGEHVPLLVKGLVPHGSLGFIAAPPKAGKTWLGLALAISVATGRPFLGSYAIPDPAPVLYIALEGHRAALRARIGCLTRGVNQDPDPASGDLSRLHLAYRPRGINLSDPAWAARLIAATEQLDAMLVVVDVLRAAARIRETGDGAQDFAILRQHLEVLKDQGRTIILLHHFGKLTETNRERAPAERMSGSGALHGALDVGLFITHSENGARLLRIDVDTRDIASPEPFGITLTGDGSGEHGGYTYRDTLRLVVGDPPAATDIKAPAPEIRDYIVAAGGTATAEEIRKRFGCSSDTVRRRRAALEEIGVAYYENGPNSYYTTLRTDPTHPSARPAQHSAPASNTPAHSTPPTLLESGGACVGGAQAASAPDDEDDTQTDRWGIH